ncbi:MAG: metalloregulator ArsR/SmtB family transcription factor [Verrucomicrobia bacterium]|nr:metalloregulator ArsR/SmtB family transcription factor [Verrucomicrobiota bacterium]
MALAAPADLDRVFFALSDATRRSLLERLGIREAAVSELAGPCAMSLPAVSKHVRILEEAGLVSRRVEGRFHYLHVNRQPLEDAKRWIEKHRSFWEASFDRLEELLERGPDAPPHPSPKTTTSKKKKP